MEKLAIRSGSNESSILLGEQIDNYRQYLPVNKVFVVSDERVMSLYGSHFKGLPVILIGQGEGIKTMQTVEMIAEKLLDASCDRSSFLLGVGGGIVCDITGFVASIFMRGVRFGFISTTLLAQVDASVGGKNGVNFGGYKNILGMFNQPDFVLCDPFVLKTLDQREYTTGLSEIIKAAAIRDSALFSFLEDNIGKFASRDEHVLEYIISRSVKIKASVVQADEREKGERRILNFGHTFGHALEKHTRMPHGEAVSIGMVLAAKLSVQQNLLNQSAYDRIIRLIEKTGLPVNSPLKPLALAQVMTHDKKREHEQINFVLLEDIGRAVNYPVKINQLEELLHDLC